MHTPVASGVAFAVVPSQASACIPRFQNQLLNSSHPLQIHQRRRRYNLHYIKQFQQPQPKQHRYCHRTGSSRVLVSMNQQQAFWVLPTTKDAFTSAVEASLTDILFTDAALAEQCATLARINARVVDPATLTFSGGRIVTLHTPEDVSTLTSVAASFPTVRTSFLSPSPSEEHENVIESDREEEEDKKTIAATTQHRAAVAPGYGSNDDVIIIVDPTDWKLIPLENLIAAFQPVPSVRLFTIVESASDAAAMFSMLQVGVDGCVLRAATAAPVSAFAALRREQNLYLSPFSVSGGAGARGSENDRGGLPRQQHEYGVVRAIRPAGVGERVCVDTCSLLGADEGLLVGSSSQALFVALSEAAEVAYVPSRPFRVNAGAVHSYCLVPGGRTRYLAELRAGDAVLAVRPEASGFAVREVLVGRSKIETRPFLIVEAIVPSPNSKGGEGPEQMDVSKGGKPVNVFVQNAETVRLATVDKDGAVGMKSVTLLEPGDRLVLRTDQKARHVGMPIDETLMEH